MNDNKETVQWEEAVHEQSGPSPLRTGRPRGFSDEEAFLATLRAIKSKGYAALTLNAIANELGCSAPALQNRFGSKSRLLQAFLRWGNEHSAAAFRRVREEHDSPIDALRERFRYPDHGLVEKDIEIGDLSTQINLIGFHVAVWSDPDLREPERERREIFEDGIVALLTGAQNAGEIEGCDPRRLGRLISAAIVGTELQWVSTPEPVTGNHLVDLIDDLIRPYRVKSDKS